jgi:hypothetical protein
MLKVKRADAGAAKVVHGDSSPLRLHACLSVPSLHGLLSDSLGQTELLQSGEEIGFEDLLVSTDRANRKHTVCAERIPPVRLATTWLTSSGSFACQYVNRCFDSQPCRRRDQLFQVGSERGRHLLRALSPRF